uniref:Rubisco LSMT substrate-binding domain-containing protein n=1 Tax=Guillardia theta TaxID=55529 RepID=A0A7S4N6N3_GUITH
MGTTAKDDIADGELYIAIPDHMLMGPERVEPGSRLDKKLMKIVKSQSISMQEQRRLLSEKNKVLMYFLLQMYNPKKESFWKPYFDIMPTNLTSPIFWSEDELQELAGSEVSNMARIEKKRLRAMYDELRERIFKHDRKTFLKQAFTLKNWFWANGLYDSRVIQLNRQTGHGNVPTFIPLIDMVNCIESQDKTFIQYDKKLRAAVMYADRAVSRGVQVFESYGNKSNYEYLLYNGFVMEDNPNDCVYISFPSSNARDVRQFCVSTTEIPYQVREWAKSQSKDAKSYLIKHIEEKRRGYRTTIAEDNELLSRTIRENHELAVRLRRHEKMSLDKIIENLNRGALQCC